MSEFSSKGIAFFFFFYSRMEIMIIASQFTELPGKKNSTIHNQKQQQ